LQRTTLPLAMVDEVRSIDGVEDAAAIGQMTVTARGPGTGG
jgi:hypothetical protein